MIGQEFLPPQAEYETCSHVIAVTRSSYKDSMVVWRESGNHMVASWSQERHFPPSWVLLASVGFRIFVCVLFCFVFWGFFSLSWDIGILGWEVREVDWCILFLPLVLQDTRFLVRGSYFPSLGQTNDQIQVWWRNVDLKSDQHGLEEMEVCLPV